MRDDVMYRIGPAESPTEYLDLVEPDMAAMFAAARRRWPNEPLFCREQCGGTPPRPELPARRQSDALASVN